MKHEIDVRETRSFEQEVARLNKKARRIGAPEITITNLGKRTRSLTTITTCSEFEGENIEQIPVEVTRYAIDMPDVDSRGWTTLARITPIEGDKPFVEAMAAGVDVTPWQAANVNQCDHCNVNRRRIISYVARHEDGRVMQFGRKCYEDTVGKDTLAAMEFQSVVVSELGFGDEDGIYPRERGSRAIPVVETARCIAMAETLYKADGWQNNVKDQFSGDILIEGTHRVAAATINPFMRFRGKNPHSDEALKAMREVKHAEQHATLRAADAIMEEMLAFPTNGGEEDEFANALKVLAEYKNIPAQKAGLAAYMGQFLRNARARARREEKKANMTHVGVVGERTEFPDLVCRKVFSYETDYGTTYVNIFEDANGNELVWKTGHGFGEGEHVGLKGTVKAHNERNGVKQTELTRCKELPTAEELAALAADKAAAKLARKTQTAQERAIARERAKHDAMFA